MHYTPCHSHTRSPRSFALDRPLRVLYLPPYDGLPHARHGLQHPRRLCMTWSLTTPNRMPGRTPASTNQVCAGVAACVRACRTRSRTRKAPHSPCVCVCACVRACVRACACGACESVSLCVSAVCACACACRSCAGASRSRCHACTGIRLTAATPPSGLANRCRICTDAALHGVLQCSHVCVEP